MDFSTLTVEDSDETLSRKPGAGRPTIENPFGPVILDSWNRSPEDSTVGSTKRIEVENDKEISKNGEPKNVVTIKGLIRRAADEQGLGVKIVVEPKGKTKTVIKFAAKVKTERTRQAENVEQSTDESVPA